MPETAADNSVEVTDDTAHERRIEVPQPPEFDAQGNRTTNYGYEFKLALWRERITDLNYDIREEVRAYRGDEKDRHDVLLTAIEGRGKVLQALFNWLKDSTVACVNGTTEVVKVAVKNENGGLKWVALIIIGVLGILYGVGVSGLGFSIGDAAPAITDDAVLDAADSTADSTAGVP